MVWTAHAKLAMTPQPILGALDIRLCCYRYQEINFRRTGSIWSLVPAATLQALQSKRLQEMSDQEALHRVGDYPQPFPGHAEKM